MNLLFHTAHAHVKSDVTWVDYVLCINSYEVIGQLKEQLILASGSLLGLWVSTLLFSNMTIYWFLGLHTI